MESTIGTRQKFLVKFERGIKPHNVQFDAKLTTIKQIVQNGSWFKKYMYIYAPSESLLKSGFIKPLITEATKEEEALTNLCKSPFHEIEIAISINIASWYYVSDYQRFS